MIFIFFLTYEFWLIPLQSLENLVIMLCFQVRTSISFLLSVMHLDSNAVPGADFPHTVHRLDLRILDQDTKLEHIASQSTLKHHFRCSWVLWGTKSINAFTINNNKQVPYGLTVAEWLHITSLAPALNTLINKEQSCLHCGTVAESISNSAWSWGNTRNQTSPTVDPIKQFDVFSSVIYSFSFLQ